MNLASLGSFYSDKRNAPVTWAFTVSFIVAIAITDWLVIPNVALGTLYVFPILFAGPILSRWQILLLSGICSLLRELFAPFSGESGMVIRLVAAFAALATVGLSMSVMQRSRELVVSHLAEKETEIELRRSAEAELRTIIETTPLAILTLDDSGRILQSNRSAERLLNSANLAGQSVEAYVPVPLHFGAANQPLHGVALQCRARRANDEPFLAHIWVGSYQAGAQPRMTMVIWDGSDDLRDREGAGFDSLMATSRILLGAVSHEIRNFVSVARTSFEKMRLLPAVAASADFQRLGHAIAGLESTAGCGLRMAAYPSTGTADLQTVLDEAWIIMEPSFRDAEIEVIWNIANNLPRVRGDQQGLVQVLINLLRNSRVALENAETKKVYISAVENVSAPGRIQVRVRDTGPGIAHPAQIFHVFPSGAQTGLGLYVSRSIVLSLGGDLRHESDVAGASFVLDLGSAPPEETPSGET